MRRLKAGPVETKTRFSIWYVLIAAAGVWLIHGKLEAGAPLPYSETSAGNTPPAAQSEKDRPLKTTRAALVEQLTILLGGRSAEEIIFGDISTGAQNDLQKTTEIAKSMVKEYGMSEALGPITYEKERRPLFLGMGFSPASKDYSEQTAEAIDREIKRLIDEAHERARLLLPVCC